MADPVTVLLIGATGMLGRPVARRLAADKAFRVRAFVRDLARGSALLPDGCECIRGDLRNRASIQRAMEDADAVYVNLATPYDRKAWDPELEGTKRVVAAAKKAGVTRLVRISAQGVPEAAERWWVARRKLEADEAVMQSGLEHTIFRPTWFMECLPLFWRGRTIMRLGAPREPLHWIAGADYADQVAAALRRKKAVDRVYTVQGPEPVSLQEAVDRFAAALPRRPLTLPVPMPLVRAMRPVSRDAEYVCELMDMTYRYTTDFLAEPTWKDLGEPTTTIEQYVEGMEETGDVPRK
ncbi:MAG: SDR family oxidoreductase [Planctomycetota bacterium]|jgi:uncharacterized protein YbjT (DUF2867 family)